MSPQYPTPPRWTCVCGSTNDDWRMRCRNCQSPKPGTNPAGVVDKAESRPAVRAEVIAVPFLDGHIPCAMVDGEPVVILRPIVEALGLRWAAQYAKVTADESTCVSFIETQLPGDNQIRRVAGVSLEAFTLWLGSLYPSRVAPEARETIRAYKARAGKALRDHFFGARIGEGDELAALEQANHRLARAIDIAKQERAGREAAEAYAAELEPAADAWEAFVDARGLISPAVFAQQSRIIRPNGKPLGQNTALQALREVGILKDRPDTDEHNTPYQAHAHRIVARPERKGAQVVNVPYIVPRHAGYLADRIHRHFYPGAEPLPRVRPGQLRAIEGGRHGAA